MFIVVGTKMIDGHPTVIKTERFNSRQELLDMIALLANYFDTAKERECQAFGCSNMIEYFDGVEAWSLKCEEYPYLHHNTYTLIKNPRNGTVVSIMQGDSS